MHVRSGRKDTDVTNAYHPQIENSRNEIHEDLIYNEMEGEGVEVTKAFME